jgi:hypothetical protein
MVKTLIEDISKPIFDGIYCESYCPFKIYTVCFLFHETTGYNYKKDLPKRVNKCIKHFGKGG